jgi:hypothetical protein
MGRRSRQDAVGVLFRRLERVESFFGFGQRRLCVVVRIDLETAPQIPARVETLSPACINPTPNK